MAIAIDKSTIGSFYQEPVNATVAFTTNQAVVSNGFIVLLVTWWENGTGGSLASVSGGGLTWAVDVQGSSANGGGNPDVAIVSAQAPSGLATSTTITGTFSVSLAGGLAAIGGASFTGVASSSALDTTSAVNDTTGTTWTTANATILAGSLLFGGTFDFSSQTTDTTPATGTEVFDINHSTGNTSVARYRIESSAGAYAVGGTWTPGAQNAVSISAAYKAAAAGGGPSKRFRWRD